MSNYTDGMNLLRNGEFAAAEEKFRRAIEINPRANAWWGLMLAKTHIQGDDKITEVALAVWRKAIEGGKRTPPPLPFDCEYAENALSLASKSEREKYVELITATRNACADLWEQSGKPRPTFPEIGGKLGKVARTKERLYGYARYGIIALALASIALCGIGCGMSIDALEIIGIIVSAAVVVTQYLLYMLYFRLRTDNGFKYAIITGAISSFGQLIIGIGLGSVMIVYSGIAFIAVFCVMMIVETVLVVVRRKKK